MFKCLYPVFTSIFYVVLEYHGYINANIGPWGLETRLNIFLTSKQVYHEKLLIEDYSY